MDLDDFSDRELLSLKQRVDQELDERHQCLYIGVRDDPPQKILILLDDINKAKRTDAIITAFKYAMVELKILDEHYVTGLTIRKARRRFRKGDSVDRFSCRSSELPSLREMLASPSHETGPVRYIQMLMEVKLGSISVDTAKFDKISDLVMEMICEQRKFPRDDQEFADFAFNRLTELDIHSCKSNDVVIFLLQQAAVKFDVRNVMPNLAEFGSPLLLEVASEMLDEPLTETELIDLMIYLSEAPEWKHKDVVEWIIFQLVIPDAGKEVYKQAIVYDFSLDAIEYLHKLGYSHPVPIRNMMQRQEVMQFLDDNDLFVNCKYKTLCDRHAIDIRKHLKTASCKDSSRKQTVRLRYYKPGLYITKLDGISGAVLVTRESDLSFVAIKILIAEGETRDLTADEKSIAKEHRLTTV